METYIEIVFNIAVLLSVLYLIFFKDYLKKKGRNLADKEDIAEITVQIETVKKEFTRENEYLKANLHYIITNQIQQTNEERNAILFFFDNFSKWLNIGLLEIQIYRYHINNIEELFQKDKDLDSSYLQTNIAYFRISLMVDNEEIVNLAHQLMTQTLNFNHWTQKILLELRLNLESEKRRFDEFKKLIEINPVPPEAHKIAREQDSLSAKKKQITDTYFKEMLEEHQKVISISNQFTETVKKYLNKRKEN